VTRADRIAVEALETIDRTDLPADRALYRALRDHRDLDNDERRAVASGVHGVRCFLSRLDHLLGGVGLPVTAAHRLAAYRVDVEGRPPADTDIPDRARLAGMVSVRWPADPAKALATKRSLPQWLAERWIRERDDADALAAALNERAPITARPNLRMNGRDELMRALAAEGIACERGRIAPHAVRLLGRPDIRGSRAFREGRFEIQDEGSQLVARALGARPGETVIDLCAGAGGKTLAIADDMDDRGTLFACEPDPMRIGDLRARLTRAPCRSVRILEVANGAGAPAADRVLVDAPCSALGTLRRGPDRRWRIREPDADQFRSLQLELIASATERLRPGGRLVYATCTLLDAENRDVARAALERDPRLEPSPVLPGIVEDDRPGQVELLPHRHGTDGFFIAAFVRKAAT
jgi:16S rRNA (cytosine967-C5)-methyltransferase